MFEYPILCEQCKVVQVGTVAFDEEKSPEYVAEKTKGYICNICLPQPVVEEEENGL